MSRPQPLTHQFDIKQGNTLPTLDTVLRDGAGVPLDLTNAISVGLSMVLCEHPRTVKLDVATATFVADTTGTVSYAWAAADTDTVGVYNIEWTVISPGGGVMTVPSSGFDRVSVNATV